MLLAAQNLRCVQRRVAAFAGEAGMDFAAHQLAAEAQRKTVVGGAGADFGVDRAEMECLIGFNLQAQMREFGVLGEIDIEHRVMQIRAAAGADIHQRN